MTDTVPSAEFLLLDATEDTPSITGISKPTTLLAEIKNLRLAITDLKVTIKENIKVILKKRARKERSWWRRFCTIKPDIVKTQQYDAITSQATYGN